MQELSHPSSLRVHAQSGDQHQQPLIHQICLKHRSVLSLPTVAADRHDANAAAAAAEGVNKLWSTPCTRWLWWWWWWCWWKRLRGVRAGAGLYRSTNLLLRDVIELYPDLLLGRRGIIMRNEDGMGLFGWAFREAMAQIVIWRPQISSTFKDLQSDTSRISDQLLFLSWKHDLNQL